MRKLSLLPAAALLLLSSALAAAAQPRVFVADTMADSVAILDLATGEPRKVMKVGKLPHNFALTRDGRTLYVTDSGSQSISIIDTREERLLRQAMVGEPPANKPHKKLGMGRVKAAGSCMVCHPNHPTGTFISGVRLSRDEKELWVTEMRTQRVAVMDRGSMALKRYVKMDTPTGTAPSNIIIHPRTQEVWVMARAFGAGKDSSMMGGGHHGGDKGFAHDAPKGVSESWILAYDPAFKKVRRRVKVPYAVPYGAVFSQDGAELYVCYRSTNKVVVVDTAKGKLLRHYEVGESPTHLALVNGGTELWVTCFYDNPASIRVLDRKTGKEKKRIEVPSSPSLLAEDPATRHLYMTASGENRIVELDPKTYSVVRSFRSGAYPVDLLIVP